MDDLIKRSLQIRDKYKKLNNKNGVEWLAQDFMSGFVGDVGDLSKLVMSKRGLRGDIRDDIDDKLAHEIADCLWSICVIANEYNVNLEEAFYNTMNDLDSGLDKLLI